jgi:hypothetical protein
MDSLGSPGLRTILLAGLLSASVAGAALAGPATLDMAAWDVAAWMESKAPHSPLRLAPALTFDLPHATVGATGIAFGGRDRLRVQDARVAGNFLLTRPLPLRERSGIQVGGELRLHARYAPQVSVEGDPWHDRSRVEGRAHLIGRNAGVWLGAATEAGGMDAAIPLLGIGGWVRDDRMTVFWDVVQTIGAIPRDGGTTAAAPESLRIDPRLEAAQRSYDQITLTTARTTLRFEDDRVEFESSAGITFSPFMGPRTWAHLSTALRLTHGIALFGTAGNRLSELYAVEPADTRRATVGLRLTEARRYTEPPTLAARVQVLSWRLRRLAAGRYGLEVRAPGARVIEVMGTMTGWETIRLERGGGERWATTLLMQPGVHQLNVRADGGEWLPPPGTPTTVDGFGGTVGVVVVE